MAAVSEPVSDDGACGAKKKQGPGFCTQRAGWGTPHVGEGRCKLHGGLTPGAVATGKRRAAERAVATYGLPRAVDPHTALVEELHRSAGHVAWLGQRIQDSDEDGLTQLEGGGEFTDAARRLSVEMVLYQQERQNLTRVARTCHDVGIEERRIKMAEGAGREIANFVRGLVSDLGVGDHPRLWEIVRKRIAQLTVLDLDAGDVT